MTTNTSATFLGIAKGEDSISAGLPVRDLTLSVELEVPVFSYFPRYLFVCDQSDISLHVPCG